MNKLGSLVSVALFLLFFSTQVLAGGGNQKTEDLQPEKQECPQGASCSGDLAIKGVIAPQIIGSVVVSSEPISEKKQPTPEEIALQEKSAEARSRDNDTLVQKFFSESKTSVCSWYSLDDQLTDWLILNKNFVVDFKDYKSPSYKLTRVSKYDGNATSICTTMLVVHYSIIEEDEEGAE